MIVGAKFEVFLGENSAYGNVFRLSSLDSAIFLRFLKR